MASEPGPGALLGAIEDRAAEERARLVAAAEARAREISAAAEAECARMKTEALAGLEHELASEQLRLLGEARMRVRAEGLAARRLLLEEAFQRAGTEIAARKAGPEYGAAVEALAEEARAAVGEPCEMDTSSGAGSVAAASADGKRRAENSLEGRLGRAQGAAEHLVAQRLFGGAAGAEEAEEAGGADEAAGRGSAGEPP
jgi:vacuolar-type H+-ATPase subunit E/Vma4